YLVAAEGWKAEAAPVLETVKTGKKKGQQVEKGWACDLVPKALLVDRYFITDRKALEALQADLERVEAERLELEEEHGGDEGAFADLDKINKAQVAARIKELARDRGGKGSKAARTLPRAAEAPRVLGEEAAELDTLMQWMKLSD